MIDKELEAMSKCYEYLQDLDNVARMRVFKYLLDRYGMVNNSSDFDSTKKNIETNNTEIINIEQIPNVIQSPKVKTTAQKSSSKTKKSKSSGGSQSYSLLTSLNLLPKGKVSLKDYFLKYEAKNNFDYNIIILTYLEKELKEENIGINHFYTCYKHLNLKIPNIVQSLRDTKNRKGWIETANSDNMTVTVAGENYIDHEIKRK